MKNCERCGTKPPMITKGEFAGMRGLHAYCEHCSEDLCFKCMMSTTCDNSDDNSRHLAATDEVDDESDNNAPTRCPDCHSSFDGGIQAGTVCPTCRRGVVERTDVSA